MSENALSHALTSASKVLGTHGFIYIVVRQDDFFDAKQRQQMDAAGVKEYLVEKWPDNFHRQCKEVKLDFKVLSVEVSLCANFVYLVIENVSAEVDVNTIKEKSKDLKIKDASLLLYLSPQKRRKISSDEGSALGAGGRGREVRNFL